MNKIITETECLEIGGHCWNYYSANDVLDKDGNTTNKEYLVYYPNGEPSYRICKHCRKTEEETKSSWK